MAPKREIFFGFGRHLPRIRFWPFLHLFFACAGFPAVTPAPEADPLRTTAAPSTAVATHSPTFPVLMLPGTVPQEHGAGPLAAQASGQGIRVQVELGDDLAIELDDRNALEEPNVQLVIGLDVDLLQLEVEAVAPEPLEPGSRLVAEVALRPREEDDAGSRRHRSRGSRGTGSGQ